MFAEKYPRYVLQNRSLSGRLFQTRGADEQKPRCDKTVLVGLVCKSSCDDERSAYDIGENNPAPASRLWSGSGSRAQKLISSSVVGGKMLIMITVLYTTFW